MDKTKIRTALRVEMGSVFEVDVDSLPEEACTDTVAQWDSLGHLMLIEAVEIRFGIAFAHEEMVEMLTEDALVETLAVKTDAQVLSPAM